MSGTRGLEVETLDATFGAVVRGLALAELDDETFREIYGLWLEHALLIFPGQHLDHAEQVAFARRFGDLEFDLAPLSNVRSDGSLRPENEDDGVVYILKGNMGWHADSTYMPIQAKGAVFTAHRVPSAGGETGWADMRAAYDALDDGLRERISGLSAFHSLEYSQAKLGHVPEASAKSRGSAARDDYSGYGFEGHAPPLRPLVKVHPETGRPTLAVGRHAYGIPGLDPAESERLLADLVVAACEPPRIHHHRWAPGDAVVWDNRCLLHRARPWDMSEPRVMYHSRIAGEEASEFAPPG
ncbi:MAG TPA: TauD/TfdA family dioxygenase [Myxococcales bacterium]|nr:TauD/TfdA family dioxygenase [Myxococcales bacterium]